MNDENIEFSNACYEVLEILKHIKKEDIDKIPEDDINMLKKNANYNHNFTYNPISKISLDYFSFLLFFIIYFIFSFNLWKKDFLYIIIPSLSEVVFSLFFSQYLR